MHVPALPPRGAARQCGLIAALLAVPAAAQVPGADGRVLGHFPYGDIAADELADAPAGFALNPPCRVRRDMLADLARLLDAARADPRTGGTLRGLSCHRSVTRQAGVFARGGGDDAEARAISVAPPGHSEHTTGYAIDFAVRPQRGCPDAQGCMAASAPYRWLVANATRFGFEQSFPAGNSQGVKWEPWHWRWVGATADAPGAARARATFAAARARFPASPGLAEALAVRVVSQPPLPGAGQRD